MVKDFCNKAFKDLMRSPRTKKVSLPPCEHILLRQWSVGSTFGNWILPNTLYYTFVSKCAIK